MIYSAEASLVELSIHRIGNKLNNEHMTLSEQSLPVTDEVLKKLLMRYFLSAFEKVNEIYRFTCSNNQSNLNEVYRFASDVFESKVNFRESSKELAKYLYRIADRPKIKSGELYVACFENVQIEGELHVAIGIFKSETKESYLKVKAEQKSFNLTYEQDAVNISKLDKGCLIFNTEKEKGYKIAVIDQPNKSGDAVYWKDEFLKLKIRNDNFNQTKNVLGIYKNFVTHKLDEEFEISKTDKIDLLNRSIKYFKEKETFDMNEFADEVIANQAGVQMFKNYKKNYELEFETEIADSFDISNAAVKKQTKVYKSVLKLDRNFHIYIHGNKNLIEKGFDNDKSMNYYKIYFKEEK